MQRFWSGVKVSWSSSIAFATVGTAVTTLVVVPLLGVAFAVLMGADVASPDVARTGFAAALVAWASAIAAGIVSAVAADRMRGTFLEIHQFRRVDVAYWLSRAAVPCVLSLVTGLASVGVVFVFAPSRSWELAGRLCVLAAVTMVIGVVMGIAMAGIGVNLPDPYLGATILGAVWPVVTGVIVPVELCPAWLRVLARGVPLTGTVSSLDAWSWPGIGRDVVVACVWAAIGVAFTVRALARIRQGLRLSTL